MDALNSIDVLTARVQALEQQLYEANQALLEDRREMETFTNKISHDLHAPLRAINTYMEMINTDFVNKPLYEDAQRMIARVLTNVEEMKQMLNGLLEFYRVGKNELNLQVIHTSGLVKEICNEVQNNFPNRKIKFQIDPSHLPDAMADENLMKKVWTKLIDNAVKFSAHKEESIIEIKGEISIHEVIYSIKDNGDGFDMSYYSKLFGIFQRLHHKSEFDGIGIDLAIVNKIIAQHHGKIWAEAKVKEGAVFCFSLPQKTSDAI